jgi:hypothetical protein
LENVGNFIGFHGISWISRGIDHADVTGELTWVMFGFLGFLDVFPCFSMFFRYFFGEAGHPEYPFLAVLAQVAT